MKRIFAAIAAVLLAAVPATATTFPGLTLIYTAVNVNDWAGPPDVGTSVVCVNQSGQAATVRWRFLDVNAAEKGLQTVPIANGGMFGVGTARGTNVYQDYVQVVTATNFSGRVLIYSTQSAVFCDAVVAASGANDAGNSLHMVRFNAHPGTAE